MVCFSVVNPSSYDNVINKWLPEVTHFCPGVPIVVVGTKSDLRGDESILETLKKRKQEPLSVADGEALAKEIKAAWYLETSAKTGEGVHAVFRRVVETALMPNNNIKKKRRRKQCNVL